MLVRCGLNTAVDPMNLAVDAMVTLGQPNKMAVAGFQHVQDLCILREFGVQVVRDVAHGAIL
jgi:hypothetical protein